MRAALLCAILALTSLLAVAANYAGPYDASLDAKLRNSPGDFLKDKRTAMPRWVGATRGDVVIAYVLYQNAPEKQSAVIAFDEKARNTLFAQQLETLITVMAAAPAKLLPQVQVVSAKYKLQEIRSNLTVSAKFEAKPASTGEELGPPKWMVVLDMTKEQTASMAISTGPREPWSISANLPVNHVSEVKINDQTHTLENKEAPGLFYAGFDYIPWGDALGRASKLTDALSVKVLMKVSKKPLDSVGVGFSLRSGFFSRASTLQIFDTFSPFVAVTWTRQDKKDTSGNLRVDAARKRDFRAGLSFSIDKAIAWTKK